MKGQRTLWPQRRLPVMSAEDQELAALAGIAWERRGQPDFRASIDAIETWFDRRHIRRFERKQRELAALVQLLRETDPARPARRAA